MTMRNATFEALQVLRVKEGWTDKEYNKEYQKRYRLLVAKPRKERELHNKTTARDIIVSLFNKYF